MTKTFDIVGLMGQSSFQIRSKAAGYGELCMWLTVLTNQSIFCSE